jgi:hypothetical protein
MREVSPNIGLHPTDFSGPHWGLLMFVLITGFVAFVLVYLLPSFVAWRRDHAHKYEVMFVSFVLGWTILGWIGCLIWASIGDTATQAQYRRWATPPAKRRSF